MLYLGIDQTGAVSTSGGPKPLPVCALHRNELHFLYLPSLQRSELEAILGPLIPSKTKIILDCVLGLPSTVPLSLRQAIVASQNTEGYGRKVAAEFFQSIRNTPLEELPRRRVEVLAKANSVFQERPFQKNIQTGTFRLWKEMGMDSTWYRFPHLCEEALSKKIPIFEGYPSYSWKYLFQTKHRTPESFPSLLKKYFPKLQLDKSSQKLIYKDPNLIDAAVLAIHASILPKRSFSPPKKLCAIAPQEGWILGFPFENS